MAERTERGKFAPGNTARKLKSPRGQSVKIKKKRRTLSDQFVKRTKLAKFNRIIDKLYEQAENGDGRAIDTILNRTLGSPSPTAIMIDEPTPPKSKSNENMMKLIQSDPELLSRLNELMRNAAAPADGAAKADTSSLPPAERKILDDAQKMLANSTSNGYTDESEDQRTTAESN